VQRSIFVFYLLSGNELVLDQLRMKLAKFENTNKSFIAITQNVKSKNHRITEDHGKEIIPSMNMH